MLDLVGGVYDMPCIIVPLYLSLCLVSLYGLRVSEILLGIVEWLPPRERSPGSWTLFVLFTVYLVHSDCFSLFLMAGVAGWIRYDGCT